MYKTLNYLYVEYPHFSKLPTFSTAILMMISSHFSPKAYGLPAAVPVSSVPLKCFHSRVATVNPTATKTGLYTNWQLIHRFSTVHNGVLYSTAN